MRVERVSCRNGAAPSKEGSACSFLIALCLIGFVPWSPIAHGQAAADWPNSENYGPPAVTYSLQKSCGDFLRARVGSIEHHEFHVWLMGYISGKNSMLSRGGNVLGHLNTPIKEFLFAVKRKCERDPSMDFLAAVSLSLDEIPPVDWKGKQIEQERPWLRAR